MATRKTLIRNKDIAMDAAIGADKLTDVDQVTNALLSPTQKTTLTTGVNADALHIHAGAGMVVQFGYEGIIIAPMFLKTCGNFSNIVGIPIPKDGKVVSIAAVAGSNISDSDLIITVLRSGLALPTPVTLTIPTGARFAKAVSLSSNFAEQDELQCKVTQGQADKLSVLVEIQWR